MAIQWFPGHMTSARKKAAETMEFIDVVIEVLDATVMMEIELPGFLGIVASSLKDRLRKAGQLLLTRDK